MGFYDLYQKIGGLFRPQYISYTGVVLDRASRKALLTHFDIPPGWEPKADHMTINLGPTTDQSLLNKAVQLKVVNLAIDDKVMACGVDTEIPTENKVKHITLAVNVSAGGTSAQSNELTKWMPIKPFMVSGIVKEVKKIGQAPKKRDSPPPTPKSPDDPRAFVKFLGNKPPQIKKMALKSKYPNLSDEEISSLLV